MLQVSDSEASEPRVVHETPMLTLWHKPCVTFSTPKAIIYLAFSCPEVRPSLHNLLAAQLLVLNAFGLKEGS